MQCDKCRRRAIIHQRYSGLHLCREHFIADLESKAKKVVRFSGGIFRSDHILLVVHGDYRGCALLHFMAALTVKRPGVRLSVIVVDGRKVGNDAVRRVRDLAADLGIRCSDSSLMGDAGQGSDPAPSHPTTEPPEKTGEPLQKADLEQCARELGGTKIASDTNLDDEALVVLAAILQGEPDLLLEPGRKTEGGIPWIRPFLHIPDREVALYARVALGYREPFTRSRPDDPFLRDAQDLLASHSAAHPSAPHALVNLGERLRSTRVPAPDEDPKDGRRCGRAAHPLPHDAGSRPD